MHMMIASIKDRVRKAGYREAFWHKSLMWEEAGR